VLERPLAGGLTGKVAGVGLYTVDPTWTMQVKLWIDQTMAAGFCDYFITLQPFIDEVAGTLYSADYLRDAISAEWTTKVTAAIPGAFGALTWQNTSGGPSKAAHSVVKGGAPQSFGSYSWVLTCKAGQFARDVSNWQQPDPAADHYVWFGLTAINPLTPGGTGWEQEPGTSVLVELDSVDASDVPSTGIVRIEASDNKCLYAYGLAVLNGSKLQLSGLAPLQNQKAIVVPQLVNATAEVLLEDEGIVMLPMAHATHAWRLRADDEAAPS
jgi:hypothetical protein